MITVAALIINWNGSKDTIELLESLAQNQSAKISINAFVIDNASSAEQLMHLRDYVSNSNRTRLSIELVSNALNVGVPAAYNQAISLAGTCFDFFLRLDNDVTLPQDAVTNLVEQFEALSDDGRAILGGNVRYYHNRDMNNGGAVTINLLRGKNSIAYPSIPTECDSILGCVMLIPRSLVQALFPEVFLSKLFICNDESELCITAKLLGYKTLYTPKLIGYHKSGNSTRQSALADYYSARNWTYIKLRHSRTVATLMLTFFKICLDFAWRIFIRKPGYLSGSVSGISQWMVDRADRRIRNASSRQGLVR